MGLTAHLAVQAEKVQNVLFANCKTGNKIYPEARTLRTGSRLSGYKNLELWLLSRKDRCSGSGRQTEEAGRDEGSPSSLPFEFSHVFAMRMLVEQIFTKNSGLV